jgi:hypothetical protein
VAREEESIVLVVELKKPAEDTPAGRQKVVEELAEYIEERFDETEFSTIYAIGGIGLSFAVYKMNKPGPPEPQLVFDWSGNVTAATSFDRMVQVATLMKARHGFSSRRYVSILYSRPSAATQHIGCRVSCVS